MLTRPSSCPPSAPASSNVRTLGCARSCAPPKIENAALKSEIEELKVECDRLRQNSADEPADEPAEEPPAGKRRRKKKLEEMRLGDAVAEAFDTFRDLADEYREQIDNAPENLQQSQRVQTMEETANTLEELEAPHRSSRACRDQGRPAQARPSSLSS